MMLALVPDSDLAAAYTLQLTEFAQTEAYLDDYEYAYKVQLAEALASSNGVSEAALSDADLLDLNLNLATDIVAADTARLIAREHVEEAAVARQSALDHHLAVAQFEAISKTAKICDQDHEIARQLQDLPEERWGQESTVLSQFAQRRSAAKDGDQPHLKVFLFFEATIPDTADEAGCAAVLFTGTVLFERAEKLRATTHLEACVQSLLMGLQAAADLGIQRLVVFGDASIFQEVAQGNSAAAARCRDILDGFVHDWKDFRPASASRAVQLAADAASMKLPKQEELASTSHQGADVASGSGVVQDLLMPSPSGQDQDPKGKGKGRALALEQCLICMEEVAATRMHAVGSCLHRFCQQCLGRHAGSLVQERRFPVPCPAQGCQQAISVDECVQLITDPELLGTLKQLAIHATVPEGKRMWCPNKECSALVILEDAQPNCPMQCPSCSQRLCPWCRTMWHEDVTCAQYQALPPDRRQLEERQLVALAEERQWRQCSQCRVYVERVTGCNHISCKCGHQFCYKCGAAWEGQQGVPGRYGRCSSGVCTLFDIPPHLQGTLAPYPWGVPHPPLGLFGGPQAGAPQAQHRVGMGQAPRQDPGAGRARHGQHPADAPPGRQMQGRRRDRPRSVPCRYWQAGRCRNGDSCNFAHGEEELGEHEVQRRRYS